MMPARITARIAAILVLLLGITAVHAQESFVRLEEKGPDAALQTAYATYTRADSKVTVILYGVVHIGETAYYQRVQSDLDACDTVLFEAVTPEDPSKVPEDAEGLGKLQKTMADLLGLSFQKDGIDYTRKNLVHADMTWEQFQAALGGEQGGFSPFGNFIDGETLKKLAPMLEMAAQIGKAFMEGNPELRDSLKRQMASQLSGKLDLGAMMGEKMAQVILVERNKVALRVLDEQLETQKEGTIAIFYGAAHMPDMEERLQAMGWTRQEKRWVSAWKMGRGIESDPPMGDELPAGAGQAVPSRETGKVWY